MYTFRVLLPITGAWLRAIAVSDPRGYEKKPIKSLSVLIFGGIAHESRKKRAKPFHNKGGSFGRIPSLPGSK